MASGDGVTLNGRLADVASGGVQGVNVPSLLSAEGSIAFLVHWLQSRITASPTLVPSPITASILIQTGRSSQHNHPVHSRVPCDTNPSENWEILVKLSRHLPSDSVTPCLQNCPRKKKTHPHWTRERWVTGALVILAQNWEQLGIRHREKETSSRIKSYKECYMAIKNSKANSTHQDEIQGLYVEWQTSMLSQTHSSTPDDSALLVSKSTPK